MSVRAHRQTQSQCLDRPHQPVESEPLGRRSVSGGLTKPPDDSDEQPEFRQMETLLELEERQMTAKTILSKAALPGASNFSRDAVQAQNGFGLLLGSCFQIQHILEQSQYRRYFAF